MQEDERGSINWKHTNVNQKTVEEIFRATMELMEDGKKYDFKMTIKEKKPRKRLENELGVAK